MSIAVSTAFLIAAALIRRGMFPYSSAILFGVSLVTIAGWNHLAGLWSV